VGSIYIAGEAGGAMLQILIADRLGRIRFMQLACVIVTIGCAIQTASVNLGMFLAGRVISGVAVGSVLALPAQNKLYHVLTTTIRALSGTVPIYLAEISAPQIRGFIGGLSGVGLSMGTMLSSWVGFACGYAPYGAAQWRVPLALQLPWGIIMFVGLATFMPNSPRQLVQKGKIDEARAEFCRIRADLYSHEVQEEFGFMRAQIEYEQNREILTIWDIYKLYRHRVLVYVVAGLLVVTRY
jgi:MFS family permease